MSDVTGSVNLSTKTFADCSIVEQQALLAAKQISAVEAANAYFATADANKHLNIYITDARETALAQARAADARRAAGSAKVLDGIAIAVKDNYCTNGIRTTAASRILENFVPTYESTVTQKLLDAGAVLTGKTNLDEFAMGSSTESSFFGPTINPTGDRLGFKNLVPGGSSGGSAAAVAANFAVAALGSDTGGSIRQPASFCGVVGFKPTYGVCSRWGIIAYASSLDQAGVFAKTVGDVAAVMDVIAGSDAKDSTSIENQQLAFNEALAQPARKLRIGFPAQVLKGGATADTDRVWQRAKDIAHKLNAEIVEVSLPTFKSALPAYYVIALSEASSNLARYDGVRYGRRAANPRDIIDMYEKSRSEGFGPEVRRRIMAGTFTLSAGYYDAYYLKAQKVRNKIVHEFAQAYAQVDLIVMPTTPSAAFAIGSHSKDPVEMYLEDLYTVPVNLAGLPAISLPVAKSQNGMPLGLQIIGKQLSDELVLQAAARFEAAVKELA